MAVSLQRSDMPTPQQPKAEGLSIGLVLLVVLVASLIGGIAVVGYAMLRPPPETLEAVVSATAPRGTSDALAELELDDGTWTDADLQLCKAEASAAKQAAASRKAAAANAGRVDLGPDPTMVERATYLLCGATRKPLHLCESYWKRWFVEATTAYASEFRQVSSEAYWTRFNLAERGREAENPELWQIVTDDLAQTMRDLAKLHEDITAALRARIADGIVAPEDFGKILGFGIPSNVRQMIGDAKPVRQLCA
jgi:hypothetical protein